MTTTSSKSATQYRYGTAVLLGVTGLLGWNSWITAQASIGALLVGSGWESTFVGWIGAVFCVSNLLTLTATSTIVGRVSAATRVRLGLVVQIGVFCVAAVLLSWRFLPVPILFVLVAMSAASAALQSAAYSLLIDAKRDALSVAVSGGQGVAGLAVSILALFFLDAGSALFYVGIALSIACLFAQPLFLPVPPSVTPSNPEDPSDTTTLFSSRPLVQQQPLTLNDRIYLLKLAKEYALAIFLDFTITLAVFPALTASVKPISSTTSTIDTNHQSSSLSLLSIRRSEITPPSSTTTTSESDWFTPIMFILFNAGDLTGKFFPSILPLSLTKNTILSLSLSRILFIPLLMSCNVPSPHILPTLFGDSSFMFIVFLLGFTNGWIGSLVLSQGPVDAFSVEYSGGASGILAQNGRRRRRSSWSSRGSAAAGGGGGTSPRVGGGGGGTSPRVTRMEDEEGDLDASFSSASETQGMQGSRNESEGRDAGRQGFVADLLVYSMTVGLALGGALGVFFV